MSERPARHVLETLLSIPWALSEDYARRMLAIAGRQPVDLGAIAAEPGRPLDNARGAVTVRDGIATIPISGPIFRYADLFAEISGATSYEALALDITRALNDSQVKAILLDIDSPGGEVFGAGEISDLLYNARGVKPIVAHVGGFCASAALWIASAADEVIASSVALLGSVGAMMSMTVPNPDRQEELFGEREVEFISSQSPNKNVDPTTKEGRAQYQAIVDRIAGVFAADLARNYALEEDAVWAQFGQGKLFVGADAVAAGMASRISSFESVHRHLAQRVNGAATPLFGRAAAALQLQRPAASATVLAQLFRAVELRSAVRTSIGPSARAIDVAGLLGSRSIPDDGGAVVDSPAPKADHKEQRTMKDDAGAAPAAGAPKNDLAEFKTRLNEISNLCAAAGCPERALELAESDQSIGAISLDLMKQKKAAETAEPIQAGADPSIRVGADRAAEKPFATLGEQLQAIAAAGSPSGTQFGAFRGGVQDKRLLHINAAASGGSAGVGSDAGFLIQKDFAPELMKEGFETGILASRCSQHEVTGTSDGLEVVYINETSRATGSRWGGVRVYRRAEADTVTATRPKDAKWECRLEDLMGIAYMTERQLQDAPAMQQVYQEAFAEEFGFVIDDEIYRGTGAGQMLGILNAPPLVTVNKESGQAADTIVFENISKMWAQVLPRSKARGFWVINTECNPQLDKLNVSVGTGGQLVYMPAGGLSASPYGMLKGRPVLEIEQASALGDVGDIAFLDLTQYKIVSKGGVRAEDSMHVRFIYDERCFKWVARVNGQPKLKSAITPYKGASGAKLSHFVTLQARG